MDKQKTMQLINFHTHKTTESNNIQILNIFAQDLALCIPDALFTSGIHPWHLDIINETECFQNLEQLADNENLLAIGECGLDRSVSIDFAEQKRVFIKQIEIAGRHHKPIIIHCVRAYSDLLNLKKKMKSDIPWIIHGFNGNQTILQSLVKHGFYFSAGESLLINKTKSDIFRDIPINRLFLETDDNDVSIEKIYLFAAQILKIEVEQLIESIFTNFNFLFRDGKLVAKD